MSVKVCILEFSKEKLLNRIKQFILFYFRPMGWHHRPSKWKGACFINFHYDKVKLFWSPQSVRDEREWLEPFIFLKFLIAMYCNETATKWEYYNDKSIAKSKFGQGDQSPGCVQFAYESQFGQVEKRVT